MGVSGLAALGSTANADDVVPAGGLARITSKSPPRAPAKLVGGKIIQPERELALLHETDVLVVGAGPAGVAAALAASQTGAKVTLVERYGHFGGLWTGGLVVLVVGMYVKDESGKRKQVTRGMGEFMMARCDKLAGGIVNHRAGSDPTVDAEALKYAMVELVEEAKVKVFLHCWGVDAIVDGHTVKGAVFESKSGRQAILAKVVVDASGDGDIYAAAGAGYEHIKFRTGLVHRIGNVPDVKGKRPGGSGGVTPVKGVRWVNMQGPAIDGLDVAELTRLELAHRRYIWKSVGKLRSQPGHENVYLLETAPQLGVRITRLLGGVTQLTFKGVQNRVTFPDVIGVGGMWNAVHPEWQIPYGALIPKQVDGVIAAGRCISGEPRMADLLRVIPPCFVTGHAAGVAAALAVKDGCRPRDVEVPTIQKILKDQDAYLG